MPLGNSKRYVSAIRSHPVESLEVALAWLLVLFAFYAGSNIFSPVRFDREKIEINVADGHIHVRGLYHYRNRLPLPLSFSLGLPFPVDDLHAAPSSYSVWEALPDGSVLREIATRKYHGNVVFRLFFWPSREKWIGVDYRQQAAAPNGRYILLTTRKWNQSLERGEYVLHLGNSCELVASNYALQKSTDAWEMSYSFARQNFLPAEDWIFSWKPAVPLAALRRDPE